ncbi:MAG: ABC transporter ATP-binding protein [Acetilactobacillus jinshanensis]
MSNKLNWFPIDFSKGMKQKVMITCAFLTDAKLFIIDEPFLGLDPLAVHDLLSLIHERKAQGSSILMTTHVLDTAQKVCDRFVLIHNGRIRTESTMGQLREKYHKQTLSDVYLSLAKDARK